MKSTSYNTVIVILIIILLGMIGWIIYPEYIKPNFNIEDKITQVQNNLEEDKKVEETKKEKEISPLPEYSEPLVIKKEETEFTGIEDFEYNLIYYKNNVVYEKDLETNQDKELFTVLKDPEESKEAYVSDKLLSPDGKKIAYTDKSGQLKIYDRETKEIQILNQNVQDFKVSNIQWAYNNQYISVTLTNIDKNYNTNSKIGIVNVKTGEYQFLDVYSEKYELLLAWHPFKLEFTYWGEGQKNLTQAIIQDEVVTGKKDLPVAIGFETNNFTKIRSVFYSPDGDKTIYIYNDDEVNENVYYSNSKIVLMNSNGTEARYLSEFELPTYTVDYYGEAKLINNVLFTLDSKEILVTYYMPDHRDLGKNYEIYRYNLDTKEKKIYIDIEVFVNAKLIENTDNEFFLLENSYVDTSLDQDFAKLNVKLINLKNKRNYNIYIENVDRNLFDIESYTIGLVKK